MRSLTAILLLPLLLVVAIIGGCVGTSPAHASTPDPIVIGHRGVTLKGVPENTLTAFRTAVKGGADMLETDVQFTKDNRAVILHDATLTRTTTCTGRVKTKTLKTVRRCKTDDGKPVATFGELLDYARSAGVKVDAEVKLAGLTSAQARAYVAEIKAHGMTGRVVATSFYTSNLSRLKSSGMARGIIDYNRPHTAEQAAERGSVTAVNLDHTDRERVSEAHAAGVNVYVWTLRTDSEYARAKAMGVDGIITDDPAGLTKWLANH